MNKCPKCGHEWPAKNQAKGGKNRWKGMTKKQRSEEMKRVRARGILNMNNLLPEAEREECLGNARPSAPGGTPTEAKGTKKGTKLHKLSLTGEINKPRKQA
jgi:hypothetical protein